MQPTSRQWVAWSLQRVVFTDTQDSADSCSCCCSLKATMKGKVDRKIVHSGLTSPAGRAPVPVKGQWRIRGRRLVLQKSKSLSISSPNRMTNKAVEGPLCSAKHPQDWPGGCQPCISVPEPRDRERSRTKWVVKGTERS